MQKIVILLLLQFSFISVFAQNEKEISLFNSQGKPVAYIDTDDDDLTIYLWDGKPVAYLSKKDGDFHIYGFNGKHLGWYIKGIIRDHDGNAVGASKEAINMYTEFEPYKSFKQYKPFKSYKEFAPYQPYPGNSWSSANLKLFLLRGINDD